MKALSIQQPWAWLIAAGHKTIENRCWSTKHRGLFLIHASLGMTRGDYDACGIFVDGISTIKLPPFDTLERGGVVGIAMVIDCVLEARDPWFCGPVGFVIRGAQHLPFTPCKGRLNFFEMAFAPAKRKSKIANQK